MNDGIEHLDFKMPDISIVCQLTKTDNMSQPLLSVVASDDAVTDLDAKVLAHSRTMEMMKEALKSGKLKRNLDTCLIVLENLGRTGMHTDCFMELTVKYDPNSSTVSVQAEDYVGGLSPFDVVVIMHGYLELRMRQRSADGSLTQEYFEGISKRLGLLFGTPNSLP